MTTDQMRSETQVLFLDDISHSADPIIMTHQLIQRYSDEIINIILERNLTGEIEALKEELILRVNALKVSSN